MLEPAALGVPVITGPSYYNFAEIVKDLSAQHILTIIETEQELSIKVLELASENENHIQSRSLIKKTEPIKLTIECIYSVVDKVN